MSLHVPPGRLITGLKEFDVLTLLSFHSNIRRVLYAGFVLNLVF